MKLPTVQVFLFRHPGARDIFFKFHFSPAFGREKSNNIKIMFCRSVDDANNTQPFRINNPHKHLFNLHLKKSKAYQALDL